MIFSKNTWSHITLKIVIPLFRFPHTFTYTIPQGFPHRMLFVKATFVNKLFTSLFIVTTTQLKHLFTKVTNQRNAFSFIVKHFHFSVSVDHLVVVHQKKISWTSINCYTDFREYEITTL